MPNSDREAGNAYQRKWYAANKKQHIEAVKKSKAKVHDWFVAYKKTLTCSCGVDDFRCLDFHHRDPATKEFNIGSCAWGNRGRPALEKEIAKCDVLCANCHRILTYLQGRAVEACHTHNVKDAGSIPAPATIFGLVV